MKRNMGMWDKGLRMFIATIIGISVFSRTSRDGLTWGLIIVAGYALVTALSGYCSIYNLFGLSTRDEQDDHHQGSNVPKR